MSGNFLIVYISKYTSLQDAKSRRVGLEKKFRNLRPSAPLNIPRYLVEAENLSLGQHAGSSVNSHFKYFLKFHFKTHGL